VTALSDQAWAEICAAAKRPPDAEARTVLAAILFDEYPAFAYPREHVLDQHWEEIVRHPGHPSRQVSLVPAVPIDCRIGRPAPPEGLSDRERSLFEKLAFSRRPNWFSGSEQILAAYVSTAIACEDLQAQLRKARPGTSDRYVKLSRLHRQQAMLAASLAVKLRLVPSSKTDKHLPNDGDRPLPDMGYPLQANRAPDDVSADVNGERSFEALRQRMHEGGRAFRHVLDEPPETVLPATLAAVEAPDELQIDGGVR
jgi:hypothetical protein